MDGILRPMQESDLELVLSWRNQEHIRKNMYTFHEISFEEHKSWWLKQSINPETKLMIFELDNLPIGFVSFSEYSGVDGTATWAFYSGDSSKRGIGRLMEYHALIFAFDKLKIRKLNCEVLSFNKAVIKMHQRYGFNLEGVFKEAYIRGDEVFDIYRLSMLSKSWKKYVKDFFEKPNPDSLTGKTYQKSVVIDSKMVSEFARISQDYNPIHFDCAAAQSCGFDRQIVHGLLGISFFSGIFGTEIDKKGLIYVSQTVQFLKPIYINSEIVVKVKIIAHIDQQIIAETKIHFNDELMVTGTAKLMLQKVR